MLTLLIADDEAIEREALKKMIADGIQDVKVVGEAANGRQAVQLARTLSPDIIMMDIKMPGTDGIEAVKTIHAENPKTKFIMVSAFDTFEYARQVMKVGVKEYLLKPSTKEEILETVRRVAEEIKREKAREIERERMEAAYQKALAFIQSEWVAALLLDHIQDAEVDDVEALLNPHGRSAYAIVCQFDEQGQQDDKKAAYRWIKQWFEEAGRGYVGPMTGDQVPIFALASNDGGKPGLSPQAEAVQMVDEMMRRYRKAFSVPLRVGIGTPVASAERFHRSYQEALRALHWTKDGGQYLYYHPSLEKPVTDDESDEKERNIMAAVKSGDGNRLVSAFHDYFGYLERKTGGDVRVVRERLRELWVIIVRFFREMGIDLRVPPPAFEEAGDLNRLREEILAALMRALNESARWQKEDAGGLLFQAKEYIKARFTAPLTLEEVSQHVGLSPYYFSKLFKEHTGMTFIEYVTKLRMERAMALMATTDSTLKEVCFEVGYRDPNYFSRAFKKWTGQTPSAYRKTQRRKSRGDDISR